MLHGRFQRGCGGGNPRRMEFIERGVLGMDVRVITLRYQEGVQGFPEEALRKAISGRGTLRGTERCARAFLSFVKLRVAGIPTKKSKCSLPRIRFAFERG